MSKDVWWKGNNKPVNIGSVVDHLFVKKKILKRQDSRIFEIWKEVNDDETLAHTMVMKYYKTKLYVCVDSTAYMFELKNFKKQAILKKLKNYNKEIFISSIVFQVGDLKS